MNKIKSLNFQQAKHLVERTGLGTDLDKIESLVGQSSDAAISSIVSFVNKSQVPSPQLLKPSEIIKARKQLRKQGKQQAVNKLYRKERDELKAWALKNLLNTKNPLQERMVWFWHNHFTSSSKNVRIAHWLLQQDQSIRSHALSNFSTLLKTMAFDPAMLIYLDGKSNKKGQPNENFARELLELFTLGEGNYTENDIKEAARAFTGWNVNNKKDKAIFRKNRHDTGVKTFMGQTGNFNGEDILDILLNNPRTAEFIAEKLWYEFVSTKPAEPEVIKVWANTFYSSNYDISTLLKTIFQSDAFWDEKYKGTLIKSPIDLVVGTLRTFDLEDNDLNHKVFLQQLRIMGQDLFDPPNVKGWVGGKAWIDDDSLLRRHRFLQRIIRGQAGAGNNNKMRMASNKKMTKNEKNPSMSDSMMASMKMSATAKNNGMNVGVYELPDLSEKQWEQWLLPIPAITDINKKSKKARLSAIVLDPAYQLK